MKPLSEEDEMARNTRKLWVLRMNWLQSEYGLPPLFSPTEAYEYIERGEEYFSTKQDDTK